MRKVLGKPYLQAKSGDNIDHFASLMLKLNLNIYPESTSGQTLVEELDTFLVIQMEKSR